MGYCKLAEVSRRSRRPRLLRQNPLPQPLHSSFSAPRAPVCCCRLSTPSKQCQDRSSSRQTKQGEHQPMITIYGRLQSLPLHRTPATLSQQENAPANAASCPLTCTPLIAASVATTRMGNTEHAAIRLKHQGNKSAATRLSRLGATLQVLQSQGQKHRHRRHIHQNLGLTDRPIWFNEEELHLPGHATSFHKIQRENHNQLPGPHQSSSD